MSSRKIPTPATSRIDYEAIANRIESSSGHAAYFLHLQAVGRKVGVRTTTIRTVVDKLKGKNAAVSLAHAGRILCLFSELGLGTVIRRSHALVIRWNPRLDVIALGFCLAERARQRRVLYEVAAVSKGRMLVCMMPSGSFDALVATGLARRLEIELLRKPEGGVGHRF
jgi:hypothetical protein